MLKRILDRPVSVTMVLLVFVVLGIVGMCRLPVSLIPDVDIPYVTVQVNNRTMSARELDESIVQPLRQNLEQISHLKEISSESRDGSASITLNFDEDCDIDYFFIEVNEKVDRALSSLPKMDRPKVFKAKASDIPAFFIDISLKEINGASAAGDTCLFPVSDKFRDMSKFATDVLAKRVEQLSEVAMVDVSGTSSDEILVIPDENALRRIGISVSEFETCIASSNVTLSNLTIRDGEYHYNVKFKSFAKTANDIANLYFRVGDRVMQIKDVARVIEHTAPRNGLVTSDGKDAVAFAVIKQSEARMANLRNSIDRLMKAFSEEYPELDFKVSRNQTELLDYSIRNLLLNIIVAILLDCLVIFLFMKDLRSPLLVSLTIPVSLAISFFVFFLVGVSINIISLSGLLLGVGMMVDNTIILTDNITAHWCRGVPLRDAVTEGTSEVRGAMLSSVLTTCAVFMPLIFMNGLTGALFFDQAITITVVLLVSYLVSIIVIPVYYWRLYRHLPAFKPVRFLTLLEIDRATRMYDIIISWFMKNKWTAWAIPLACTAAIAICLSFMPKEKIPPITYTDAILNIDWNEHITLEENRRRVSSLEVSLKDVCCQSTALIGVQQFVLRHSGDISFNEASFYFKCRTAEDLAIAKNRLSTFISVSYPSAIVSYTTSGNVFDIVFSEREPELVARLRQTGTSRIEVNALSEVLSAIRNAVPETDIENLTLKTDILYTSDPELMALYGVSFSDLSSALTNSMNGNCVFEIVQGTRSVPVVMGTDIRQMEKILSETTISVRKNDGSVLEIPAGAVMHQSSEQDLKTLVSGSEGAYYPVNLDVQSRNVKDVISRVEDAVHNNGNFDVKFSGAWFSNKDMLRQMAFVLVIAILLLFLILASQFESLLQPSIILSEVVVDIAVSLSALWILGVSINIMSLIGLVVICGIVINDSILKIDTINRLRRHGMDIETAIKEAGHRRFKPIIMTSVTTILAVAPFLSRGNMGDDLQYPMALVIIVGMTIGTIVSLFFVPTIYSAIYRKRE